MSVILFDPWTLSYIREDNIKILSTSMLKLSRVLSVLGVCRPKCKGETQRVEASCRGAGTVGRAEAVLLLAGKANYNFSTLEWQSPVNAAERCGAQSLPAIRWEGQPVSEWLCPSLCEGAASRPGVAVGSWLSWEWMCEKERAGSDITRRPLPEGPSKLSIRTEGNGVE